MPLYEYQCDACGHRFEVIQKFSDAPIETCEKCGGQVRKLLSSPAIQFKGSGWYITDYARAGNKSESKSESQSDSKAESKSDSKAESKADGKGGSASDSSSSSTTSDSASKGDAKPGAKTESKAAS